jgi:hypothetical protein
MLEASESRAPLLIAEPITKRTVYLRALPFNRDVFLTAGSSWMTDVEDAETLQFEFAGSPVRPAARTACTA